MSDVQAHLSLPGGTRRQGKAASGRRGRRHGVEIKPGTVKQARAEAGLSLGQVARNDVSRTAIYFVETGKAKPSIETLALIAQRTGKPLDFFLAEPMSARVNHAVTLAELDRLLASGDYPGVIKAGEAALGGKPDPEWAARLRCVLALGYLRGGQPLAGRREASHAREHFEQTGDRPMVAECLGTEAAAASVMMDPSALALAEAGLALCRSLSPVPVPTEARLLSIVGAVYTSRREWQKAIEAYERAVEVGNVVQDLRTLSFMYGNLSLAYQEIGRVSEALRYADRALTVYETLNDRLALARYENNLAILIFGQGNVPDALRHADRSLRLFDEIGIEVGKAHVFMTLCELELSRGRTAEAERHARGALEVAERMGERSNVGQAHVWLARIAEANGDRILADGMFAAAIEILTEAGPAERVTGVHVLYAETLEGRGELVAANAHLKLALRASQPRAVAEARAATA